MRMHSQRIDSRFFEKGAKREKKLSNAKEEEK